jgi:hypothetical protein
MTNNDLPIRHLYNDHGRNEHTQNIWKEDVRKIYRPVKEGERWRIRINKEIKDTLQRDDTNIYNILPSKMAWSCWKDAKPKNAKTKLQQLQWEDKVKKEDHVKDGGVRLRVFKYNGK